MKNEKPVRALGLWNMGDGRFHSLLSPEDAKRVLRRAFDSGICTFDTAVSYGNADTFLAAVMRERRIGREEVKVYSKVMPVPTMARRTEGELRNLRSEYIDVLMLHWPTEDKELFRSLQTLEKLKETQKAREIGVSNFPLEMLKRTVSDFPISYHERPLSPIWTKEYEEEKALGLRTIAYAPGAFGIFGEKYNSSLPPDSRKDLYIWKRKEFLSLRSTIQDLSKRKGTTPYQISFSFTERLEPYAMAFGAGIGTRFNEDPVVFSEEEFQTVLGQAKALSDTAPSDNIFGHNWRLCQ